MVDEKQKLKSASAKNSSDVAATVKVEEAGKDHNGVKVKKVAVDGSVRKRESDSGGQQAGKDKTVVKVKKEAVEASGKVKKESESGVEIGKQKVVTVKKESSSVKTEKGGSGKSNVSTVKIVKKQSGKLVTKNGKTTVVKEEEKEKQKKVYELPGQKHDPPEERDPLRIFYQSLHEQIPTSEMAELWMMEHGLLPKDRAKKAYERKLKRQQQQKLGTPTKPSPSAKQSMRKVEKDVISNGKSKTVVTKVFKVNRDDHSDDEFLLQPKKKLKLGH
ncbi:hypothetical protein O6H91_Y070400 [Diphasiastrum complanatum]|nr:hypothetical protein O6H91_Y070400 [Diphasiastrum complanatum]